MFGINTAAEAEEHLAELRAKTVKPEQMFDYGLDLARWEGYAEILAEIEKFESAARDHGMNGNDIAFVLMTQIAEILARGADDQWSGRRNDQRRARFDGRTEGARAAIVRIKNSYAVASASNRVDL